MFSKTEKEDHCCISTCDCMPPLLSAACFPLLSSGKHQIEVWTMTMKWNNVLLVTAGESVGAPQRPIDCISQDPLAAAGPGYHPGTGRAGFYCFHRCCEERGGVCERERRLLVCKNRKNWWQKDTEIKRVRGACGGGKKCWHVCEGTAGGLDRKKTTIFLSNDF